MGIEAFWSIFKVFLALFLVFLNGFFVAAEFSMVKVRRTRLAELSEAGSHRAKTALDITGELDAYLSACQLGITLASLGLGWLGEPAIAALIEPLFENLTGWTPVYTHTVAIVIAFITITILHIVLGELVPKSLAIQKAEKIVLLTAGWLRLFHKVFYPATWALNGIANKVVRKMGLEPSNTAEVAHSPEEIRLLVDSSQKHGAIDKMEGVLLDNVFDFTDRTAFEVMVPRQDMVCLYTENSIDEARQIAKKYGHVRYPLCQDDKDNIIGLIHVRDLLSGDDDAAITELVQLKRDILFVPETMLISQLLKVMRAKRARIVVAVDEFGGTSGIVTIEDIVEELVGEIYDEFEQDLPVVVKLGEQDFEFHGRLILDDVAEILGIKFGEEPVSTIGGYIASRLGRMAVEGDKITYQNYTFTVTKISGHRILKVRVTANKE